MNSSARFNNQPLTASFYICLLASSVPPFFSSLHLLFSSSLLSFLYSLLFPSYLPHFLFSLIGNFRHHIIVPLNTSIENIYEESEYFLIQLQYHDHTKPIIPQYQLILSPYFLYISKIYFYTLFVTIIIFQYASCSSQDEVALFFLSPPSYN